MGPTKEEKNIDKILHNASKEIDVTEINPINAESIKKNYSGDEPDFVYDTSSNYTATQEQLRKIRIPRTSMVKIFKEKRKFVLKKIDSLNAIGTPTFTKYSKHIHPLPKKRLVKYAWEILERKQQPYKAQIKESDALKELQETFTKLGLSWKVKKMDMIASANVIPSQRLLYLKKKTLFSKRYIERLKIHEIGTHAVRAENGRLQPLKIFLHGFANYLPTEEGLAAYNEERFDLMDNAVFRTYAGRVVAVDLAQKHTFTELVEILKTQFSEKKSLTIALRAKRGVGHGSELGGYTKDAAYLQGYVALKKYAKKGGDFRPLYYGKVGLQHLPLLKKIEWLKEPKYFPEDIFKN